MGMAKTKPKPKTKPKNRISQMLTARKRTKNLGHGRVSQAKAMFNKLK